MALRNVQALVLSNPDGGVICKPELLVSDALGVGHSIRSLVRSHKLPPGTAAIYERVANQMIAAARLAVTENM